MTLAGWILVALLALAAAAVLALLARRRRDAALAERTVSRLVAAAPASAPRFDPAMVAELPEPARRFLTFAIRPGTPLARVAVIEMTGTIGLGDATRPGYRPMRARQVLSAFDGLVWQVEVGSGRLGFSGSDGFDGVRSWTRFRLAGLVPVVAAGGTRDHLRSAFGRVVAEAAFWLPAAFLPGEEVTWEAVGSDRARARVRANGMEQSVEVRVGADGRPLEVSIPRWSDANPEKRYRLQPFGGTLGEHRETGGYTVPMRVEGGNLFGTEQYFPFYRASLRSIRFLPEA